MNQIEKLALDVAQTNPDNFVPSEQHAASDKILIARLGGFFRKGFTAIQAGRKLILGVDFKYVGYSQEANLETGQEVFFGIVLLNDSTSPVLLSYHAVGGKYTLYIGVIVDMINELNLVDDVVRASDIIDFPATTPPAPHRTHGDDLIGLDRVVEMLARLVDAVLTGNPAKIEQIQLQLDNAISRTDVIRLNPSNGHTLLTSPLANATTHDLEVPRSEAQTGSVFVELMVRGDEGVFTVTIAYDEVPSGVSQVSHCRAGNTAATTAQYGVTRGNGNKTLIRLFNAVNNKTFKEVFVKSIATSNEEEAYAGVKWLANPSEVTMTLRDMD